MQINLLAAGAQGLLNSFATELAALGIDVPPAQYVASGIVAWDGESLTVYLGTIDQGQPGAPIGTSFQVGAATILSATFYVQILRETPALNGEGFAADMTPSPDVLGEAGLMAVGDAGALIQAAIAIHTKYLATGPGEGFKIGPVTPLGPEGGLGGMRLALEVSLG
jgi:hypothetical protein